MAREDVYLDEEPLLIITRRDPICTFLSLALLLYRAKRKLYTHIAYVDSLLSPSVQDLLQHYDNVLSLDLADNIEGEAKHRLTKYNIVIEVLRENTFHKMQRLVEEDETALTMLEVAAVMYNLEYKQSTNLKISRLSPENLPPLPGVTYRPIIESLTLSLWPYIPDITGNPEKTEKVLLKVGIDPGKSFKEIEISQIDKLLFSIVELYDSNKCLLSELDKFTLNTYIFARSTPVQDIYLLYEAAYALNDSTLIKSRDIFKGVKILQLKSIRDKLFKYAELLRQALERSLKDGKYTFQSLTLALRVYRMLKVHKKRNVTIRVKIHENIMCCISDHLNCIEKYSSRTILRMPDNTVIECVQL